MQIQFALRHSDFYKLIYFKENKSTWKQTLRIVLPLPRSLLSTGSVPNPSRYKKYLIKKYYFYW